MNGDRKGFADLAFYFHTDDVPDMMAVNLNSVSQKQITLNLQKREELPRSEE